ncbi:MAG TPA: hypothetical protein VNA67_01615 [Pseudonocardiaceae bacterium]|nr:hypothetical protein [Pseudonocardiaceae bacterium]
MSRFAPRRTPRGCSPHTTSSWARAGLGTFPIRFPHPDNPGDDGWHVEAGYSDPATGGFRLNLRSRGRALLMLFLFSDVGPDDAPTRIRVGSHLDVPPLLAPAGNDGMEFVGSPSKRSRRRRTVQ